ncbi:hypothetical protein NQ315_004084 [Exocentrus adspersus]|uniref:C2 domain-containing protein n=1 Tax=Exocentrus adspersus TaxID=1586481 RepID=A0AAV8W6N9_9CUCU|nr:hypothetical protein NQ315_004084 [Exocentrus adspersus]
MLYIMIYQSELELQPEFDGFNDMLTSFHMYKGKRTGDETVDEENITGIFKGSVRIYRWPQETNDDFVTDRGMPLQNGIFQNYPDNLPVRFLLRVYCVQGLNLRPKDRDGKSDPYLRLTLHDKTINDRENTIPRQVNPVFGKVYEFNGNFPNDHTLRIAIWDSDKGNNDDLIGETEIDIENRFYTKHRAFCGIPDHYAVSSGYCAWRGRQKPTAALLELCRTWGLTDPEYQEDFVRIGMKLFITEDFQRKLDQANCITGLGRIDLCPHVSASEDTDFDREVLALTVLRRWQEMPVVGFPIVPEHVETRSLYNPSKPGIEQGKMQLWIDIFPVTDLPPPNSVVITPRTPEKYELRVIIWNTEEVKLAEDDFFIGERKSDIYIKGWLTDNRDSQYTDVHYKSLTGEGNFNWRFVFPFEYLSTENKLVIRRKESIFAAEETEFKIPCRLTLQVWDNDTLSRDDFLGKGFLSPKGSLSFELSKMPRGARMAKKCTLSILEPNAPRMNLFKARRTKGWWPFKRFDQQLGKDVLQGKLEAELEIVTSEDADKDPAGLGRQKPQALPVPKRPDVSFSWLSNPLRALKFQCGTSSEKMPNLPHLIQMVRNWRIDADDFVQRDAVSTPIITVLPIVEEAQKIIILDDAATSVQEPKDNIFTWWLSSLRSIKNKISFQSASGSCSELQNMLPSKGRKGSNNAEKGPNEPGVCLISESPYRILRIKPK